MKKQIFILLSIFIFFIGCDNKKNIKLAVNEWIGYAPLFYANEKGWLSDNHITLVKTSSLGESLSLYRNGLVNGLASTQYEYLQISHKVKPIILLDKSYGGDMILSNKPLKDLLKSKDITAYLEIASVNFLLLKYFLKEHNISMNNINLISSNQGELLNMVVNYTTPILVVTYAPYDIEFKKLGFKTIASTKNDKELLIIDAIFIDKKLNEKDFISLKKDIDRAIEEITINPRFAFNLIKKYYPEYEYKDFVKALKKIKWINKPNKNLIQKLKKINFPINSLL